MVILAEPEIYACRKIKFGKTEVAASNLEEERLLRLRPRV
jgi:hypothetical protein